MTAQIERGHSERGHAVLSASAAHRWLACPPSARREADMLESYSEYAAEGTLAHEIAELYLTSYLAPTPQKTFNTKLNKFKKHELYKPEMLTHVESYMDYIKSVVIGFGKEKPFVTAERKVNFDNYVPDGFGTSDCIIIGGNTLIVVDFKYGKGVPVSAESNSQMRLYALGAYAEYSLFYDIRIVRKVIVQPRLDSVSESEISIDDLLTWGESIKPIAEKAHKGEGEYRFGDHCQFCKIKATCSARADTHNELTKYIDTGIPVHDLTLDEISHILSVSEQYKKWITHLEEYAFERIMTGDEIDGWKLVKGRDGVRKYADMDAFFDYLITNNITDKSILYDNVPVTVTELEKRLGKTVFAEHAANFITRDEGKPTLAKATDKRPSYSTITAVEAFKDII